MSETHVNAFKQDVTDAFNKVQRSLGDYQTAVDALVSKVESTVDPVPVPEPAPVEVSEVVPPNEAPSDVAGPGVPLESEFVGKSEQSEVE